MSKKTYPKVMVGAIPFTEEDVMGYLDKSIKFWRKKRKIANQLHKPAAVKIAEYYVDAFQSARVTLFGEVLK